MLKQQRFIVFIFCFIGLIQTANAIQVDNYQTSSFTTNSSNARIITVESVLNSSVTFEPDEQPQTAELTLCSSGNDCGQFTLTLNEGTVTLNSDNNTIEFVPFNPSFADPVSFNYSVSVQNNGNGASGVAQITIFIESASVANKNFQTIATAIDSICESEPSNSQVLEACQAFTSLSGQKRIEALSTISPEEVVAEFNSTINMTKDQTGNLSNRLNALRGGATGFSVAGLNYYQGKDVLQGQWFHEMANQIGGNASADESFSRLGIFINGSITDGEKDGTDLETGYDLEGDSITIGADYRFTESIVAGVAYGVSNSEIEFTSDNEMDNEIDNLLFYGSWYKDKFYVDGMLGYAEGDLKTERKVIIGSTINETVKGKTESAQLFFSIAGNYDFSEGPWTYGPYASYDYIDGEIDGYDEIGNSGFEVSFAKQDIKSQVLTFGGRAQYAWSQPWGIIVPHARAEWKTELEDDRDAIVGRFVLDTSGDTFAIEADDLDDSWFQVGLGLSATFQYGLSAYVDYEQVVSYDDTDLETWSFGGRWEAKF